MKPLGRVESLPEIIALLDVQPEIWGVAEDSRKDQGSVCSHSFMPHADLVDVFPRYARRSR